METRLLPVLFLFLSFLLVACERPDPEVTIVATAGAVAFLPDSAANPAFNVTPLPSPTLHRPPALELPAYQGTPTPDPTRPSPIADTPIQPHIVGAGESLGHIAQLYSTSIETLMALNALESAEFLVAGQVLQVPAGELPFGPSFKLIPDSELVYGISARDFDIAAVAAYFNGSLVHYEEVVEGHRLTGPQIVQLVADRFSVNPRLLLAALEHRAGWLTGAGIGQSEYPMGYVRAGQEGLYRQLSWAANQLNWGYYGRAEGGVTGLQLPDQTRVSFAPDINDGTAGVQIWLSAHSEATYQGWLSEVGPAGFWATYNRLFGNPFAYTVDPVVPGNLSQPPLLLPWPVGETWYFTGGPHGGWAGGSAWAALDFVAGDEQLGCYPTDAWVTAMAAGLVTRSSFGSVVVDLDGDGFTGSGWAITYMHLETRDRVEVGRQVQPGDRLGHPSCEGGFSNGTHVHIARTYNGRWISADGPVPFLMSGWESRGLAREYDGLLVNGDRVKEACECREESNAITHD